ncbi:MAG: hypothetical protein Q8R76_06210, partial [Candidatus Omnitrophota bacterium]|nr:hypothetical protein [Candidatus Omnitrophota bacterium]
MKRTLTFGPVHSWHRVTAIIVSVCFFALDVAAYAPQASAAAPAPFKYVTQAGLPISGNAQLPSGTFRLPNALGKVDESQKTGEGKTILYIQDAHDSLEAQRNIAKMIRFMVAEHGVKTVFKEGYEGPVPTDELFGFMKEDSLRRKVSFFLLDKLRIGGAEFAHINRNKEFNLIGVDDMDLYRENLDWYRRAATVKKKNARDLKLLSHEIQKLINLYFPGEIKEWIKLRKRLNRDEMGLFHYLSRTYEIYVKRRSEEGFGKQYPNLALLLLSGSKRTEEVKEVLDKIDAREIFREIDIWEDALAEAYLVEARDRQVYAYHKGLTLLRRLSEIEVTAAEYEVVRERLQELSTRELADFIAGETGKPLVLTRRWEKNIQSAIRFYEIAKARDLEMEKYLTRFAEDPDEKIAILIFGGFHKDGIKDILRRHDFSYSIVSPTIEKTDKRHRKYYKQLMSDGRHEFEGPLLAGEKDVSPIAAAPPGIALEPRQAAMIYLELLYRIAQENPDKAGAALHRLFEKTAREYRSELRTDDVATAAPEQKTDLEIVRTRAESFIEMEQHYNQSRVVMQAVFGLVGFAVLGLIGAIVTGVFVGGAIVGAAGAVGMIMLYNYLFPASETFAIEAALRHLDRGRDERLHFQNAVQFVDLEIIRALAASGIIDANEALRVLALNLGDKLTAPLPSAPGSALNLSTNFTEVEGLGLGAPVAVVAKGINTPVLLERRRAQWSDRDRQGPTTYRPVREVNLYAFVSVMPLSTNLDRNRNTWEIEGKEARGVAMRDDITVVTFADEIVILDTLTGKQLDSFTDDKFRGLHTVDFHPTERNLILVSSGGVDRFLELNIGTREITYEWVAWEHGLAGNKYGITLVEEGKPLPEGDNHVMTREEAIAILTREGQLKSDKPIVVTVSPGEVKHPLGLEQFFKAADPNWVAYSGDGSKFRGTFFILGRVVEIDRATGNVTTLLDGLAHPHHVIPFRDGYVVSDTRHARVLYLDKDFNIHSTFDFSGFPHREGQDYIGEWIQYSAPIGDGNLIATVDSARSTVYVWNPETREYSRYPFDTNLLIQSIVPVTSTALAAKMFLTEQRRVRSELRTGAAEAGAPAEPDFTIPLLGLAADDFDSFDEADEGELRILLDYLDRAVTNRGPRARVSNLLATVFIETTGHLVVWVAINPGVVATVLAPLGTTVMRLFLGADWEGRLERMMLSRVTENLNSRRRRQRVTGARRAVRMFWAYLSDRDPRVRAVAYESLKNLGRKIRSVADQLSLIDTRLLQGWITPERALDAVLFGGREDAPPLERRHTPFDRNRSELRSEEADMVRWTTAHTNYLGREARTALYEGIKRRGRGETVVDQTFVDLYLTQLRRNARREGLHYRDIEGALKALHGSAALDKPPYSLNPVTYLMGYTARELTRGEAAEAVVEGTKSGLELSRRDFDKIGAWAVGAGIRLMFGGPSGTAAWLAGERARNSEFLGRYGKMIAESIAKRKVEFTFDIWHSISELPVPPGGFKGIPEVAVKTPLDDAGKAIFTRYAGTLRDQI